MRSTCRQETNSGRAPSVVGGPWHEEEAFHLMYKHTHTNIYIYSALYSLSNPLPSYPPQISLLFPPLRKSHSSIGPPCYLVITHIYAGTVVPYNPWLLFGLCFSLWEPKGSRLVDCWSSCGVSVLLHSLITSPNSSIIYTGCRMKPPMTVMLCPYLQA